MADVIDMTGQRFGKLTVVKRHGSACNRATWECVCDCGDTRIVSGKYLRNGSAIDCGCSRAVPDEDGEVWKSVAGYEGRYEVSSHGRVKSCKRFREGDGDRRANHSVHQLVARAFIPNPNGYDQINHKDENKENNHVSNLEWCTQAYNNAYGTRMARVKKTKEAVKGERK